MPESAKRVVLVEEEISIGVGGHRWQLTRTIPVEGDEVAADERARELAMEYLPQVVRQRHGETVGRRVFRTSDGSWLAEVTGSHERVLVRITTAEQVHIQEHVPSDGDDTPPKGHFFR